MPTYIQHGVALDFQQKDWIVYIIYSWYLRFSEMAFFLVLFFPFTPNHIVRVCSHVRITRYSSHWPLEHALDLVKIINKNLGNWPMGLYSKGLAIISINHFEVEGGTCFSETPIYRDSGIERTTRCLHYYHRIGLADLQSPCWQPPKSCETSACSRALYMKTFLWTFLKPIPRGKT